MKSLQRLCMMVVLTFMLTLTTFADGHMSTGAGVAPPPPPTSSITQSDTETLSGQIPTGPGVTTTGGESYAVVVWGLLEGVLALF